MYGSAQGNTSTEGRSWKVEASSALGFGPGGACSVRMGGFLYLEDLPDVGRERRKHRAKSE